MGANDLFGPDESTCRGHGSFLRRIGDITASSLIDGVAKVGGSL